MKQVEDMMGILLARMTELLLNKLETGQFTHQDFSNAIKLLKDNDITIEIKKGDPLDILAEELPFASDTLVNE
jgi:hypothetical protein